ncbi:hypothetical protein [Streptomyces bottropensis]|uniref:hypothetical protein n=1 Tax=Streptomyces bottropensis TaxID=42235 RepID=UPI00369E75E5
MPISELIVRSLPLTILSVSALYVAVSGLLGWRRRVRGVVAPGVYPGSRKEAGDMSLAWWRSLSTEQQAAADRAALERAEESAQLAVALATEINAAYRP